MSQGAISLGRATSSFLVIYYTRCITQCLNCHRCATVQTSCPIDGLMSAVNLINTDELLDLVRVSDMPCKDERCSHNER